MSRWFSLGPWYYNVHNVHYIIWCENSSALGVNGKSLLLDALAWHFLKASVIRCLDVETRIWPLKFWQIPSIIISSQDYVPLCVNMVKINVARFVVVNMSDHSYLFFTSDVSKPKVKNNFGKIWSKVFWMSSKLIHTSFAPYCRLSSWLFKRSVTVFFCPFLCKFCKWFCFVLAIGMNEAAVVHIHN